MLILNFVIFESLWEQGVFEIKYCVYCHDQEIEHFEVNLINKRLTKNKTLVDDVVLNPFVKKNSFEEIQRILEDKSWIKYDYMGGDAIAEVIGSRVLDVLGYELIPYAFYKGYTKTCISPNFLKEESLITLDRYFSTVFTNNEENKFYSHVFEHGTFKEKFDKLVSMLERYFAD